MSNLPAKQKDEGKSLDPNLLVTGAVIIAGAIVVSKLVNLFGGDTEDSESVKAFERMPAVGNPFSASFDYKQEYNANYKSASWYLGIKEEFDEIAGYFGSIPWPQDQNYFDIRQTVYVASNQIYDAFSLWHHVDTASIYTVFNKLNDKVEVALVVQYWRYIFDKDLWEYLKEGSSWMPFGLNGLTDSDMIPIINRINSMPFAS